MNHIVFIGFMGCGKTRVGKQISKELGLPFVDVDRSIQKKLNMPLKEIFQRFGEPYYRALETMTIKELAADPDRKVISLGAGLPMQEQNQKYIPELGTVIYIKGSYETLKKRLKDNANPLLEGDDHDDKISKLLKQRDPVYAGFADIVVETGVHSFEDLVSEIRQKLDAVEKNS